MNKKTNIVFIMADDHAAKAISCYGHGINTTPNIDRIAKEGVRLDHCYVTNSICTPSRATILSGTHNHVNGVRTLACKLDNRQINVAKLLRASGYQTAMIGKWHLGEGKDCEPTGFDHWEVLPGQGEYFDPVFIGKQGQYREQGYATDLITDKSIAWMQSGDAARPFFLMCHHKAPHRAWECHPRHRHLYQDQIQIPDTFDDDYKNRAAAAGAAKMRIAEDLTYRDVGVVQPEGGSEIGEPEWRMGLHRKLPNPTDVRSVRLIDSVTGEVFTFETTEAYRHWKYQRYMQRYLRTIAAIDESVGRVLDYLDANGLAENTLVIYTSDQGFFLGEHGWFDKRFMYEESFQMPFVARLPSHIPAGTVCTDMAQNIDFAPTFLAAAGVTIPNFMQGKNLLPILSGRTPDDWEQLAYHRYWMHRDQFHNAYAHYGVRNHRYKLVYWYNQGLGLPGTQAGGESPEWELFDCELDPLELMNVYHDPAYAEQVKRMTALLEQKMAQIGDEQMHA